MKTKEKKFKKNAVMQHDILLSMLDYNLVNLNYNFYKIDIKLLLHNEIYFEVHMMKLFKKEDSIQFCVIF